MEINRFFLFVIITFDISCFTKILVWKILINFFAIQFFFAETYSIILIYLFTTIKMKLNTIFDLLFDDKSIIKSMVIFVQKFWNWSKNFINSWDLYFMNLILWHVIHKSQYFLIFWWISGHEYCFFKKIKILIWSKWFACESSWCRWNNFLFRNFDDTYHFFWWQFMSFSMFHSKSFRIFVFCFFKTFWISVSSLSTVFLRFLFPFLSSLWSVFASMAVRSRFERKSVFWKVLNTVRKFIETGE